MEDEKLLVYSYSYQWQVPYKHLSVLFLTFHISGADLAKNKHLVNYKIDIKIAALMLILRKH